MNILTHYHTKLAKILLSVAERDMKLKVFLKFSLTKLFLLYFPVPQIASYQNGNMTIGIKDMHVFDIPSYCKTTELRSSIIF